jgi:hypothetical protein
MCWDVSGILLFIFCSGFCGYAGAIVAAIMLVVPPLAFFSGLGGPREVFPSIASQRLADMYSI